MSAEKNTIRVPIEMEPINLIDCSLNDLVHALLHEQPIALPEEGQTFTLESDDARRIFAHYARHRELWPRNKSVQASEIEDVLKALEHDPPISKAIEVTGGAEIKRWILKRIEAHRFAGLHKHCGPNGEDPEDFVIEVERDIVMISGFNGAGKTALQNVIIWCLTGLALRSQHMPDEVHEPMDVFFTNPEDEVGEQESAIKLPPVVPLPSTEDLEVLDDEPKIDTWAKLTFHSEESDTIAVIQRSLTVGKNGKIGMRTTGLEDLGLSDLAIQVGTLIPGIAANMRFDEKSTFADAVAQLTGLKPLEDLGRRTQRVVDRLRKRESQETSTYADEKLHDFETKRQNIVDAWLATPDLGELAYLVAPNEETQENQCQKVISNVRSYLSQLKGKLESQAESVLGQALQITNIDALHEQLNLASESLRSSSLKILPSIGIVKNLGDISDENIETARSLKEDLLNRAIHVSERLSNKKESARWQLYARVAAWHREHHNDSDYENCPLCGSDLDHVPPDALLNKGVKEALQHCSDTDSDATKGAEDWERDAVRELMAGLPENLRKFVDLVFEPELLAIYRRAYVEELLEGRVFSGILSPLKKNAEAVWDIAISENPLNTAPDIAITKWPEAFQNGRLTKIVSNVEEAIKLANYRKANEQALSGIIERFVRGRADSQRNQVDVETTIDTKANELPLRSQIEVLRRCVTNAAPIVSLLRQLDDLEATRKEYVVLQERLKRIVRAANAIKHFASFKDLVYQQVSGLISALDHGTGTWLEKIYRSHYRGGPSYSGFNFWEEKGFGLRAGIGGMRVPAYKIMNSSQLRACVWAFTLSLWTRVRARLGGIDCVLFDDPQVHFDPINAENLGAAIPEMPNQNMKPIITSNDYRFLAGIKDKLPSRSTVHPSWHDFVINPISRSRLTAGVSTNVTEIYKKQQVWLEDENNANKATEFVIAIRTYVENRLWDLLATDPIVMYKPSLADLIGVLRTARNNGEHPFEEPPFTKLLSHAALKNDAPFYRIINEAHHHPQNTTPTDAGEVDEVFSEIDRVLRSCTTAYARFMGRLTTEEKENFPSDLPPVPTPIVFPRESIQIVGEVSARSNGDVLASGETMEELDLKRLGDVAFYGVRSSGLSPLVLQGQVVIVSLDREAEDGDAVVALYQERVFLRRILVDQRDSSRITLSCDQTGSENVPPSLLLPRASTRLLPVVGVLYSNERLNGNEEAVEIRNCSLLDRQLVSARVIDASAYPVIRDGDLVLMEPVTDIGAEEIERLEERIVVAVVGSGSDTFAYLKRLSAEVSNGIRILENVGWRGSSLAITTQSTTTSARIPSLQTLWRVHGTIRQPIH